MNQLTNQSTNQSINDQSHIENKSLKKFELQNKE